MYARPLAAQSDSIFPAWMPLAPSRLPGVIRAFIAGRLRRSQGTASGRAVDTTDRAPVRPVRRRASSLHRRNGSRVPSCLPGALLAVPRPGGAGVWRQAKHWQTLAAIAVAKGYLTSCQLGNVQLRWGVLFVLSLVVSHVHKAVTCGYRKFGHEQITNRDTRSDLRRCV